MTEPVTSAIGIKLGTLVAGFAGGVVSLAFIQGLTRWQAVMSVVVGSLSAAYLTPIALARLDISPELQNGAAFIVGLCAMNIIPLIKLAAGKLVERFFGSAPPTQGDGGQR